MAEQRQIVLFSSQVFMAVWIVKFSIEGYKIENIFGQKFRHLGYSLCLFSRYNNFLRVSTNTVFPHIVSAPLCTATFDLLYYNLQISKFKKE